jgi:hypothetical protein
VVGREGGAHAILSGSYAAPVALVGPNRDIDRVRRSGRISPDPRLLADLRIALQRIEFTETDPAFSEGHDVAVFVGVSPHRTPDAPPWETTPRAAETQFNACLSLFPLAAEWTDVTGIAVALVGQTGTGVVETRIGRTAFTGAVSFQGLPAGRYRVRLVDEATITPEQRPSALPEPRVYLDVGWAAGGDSEGHVEDLRARAHRFPVTDGRLRGRRAQLEMQPTADGCRIRFLEGDRLSLAGSGTLLAVNRWQAVACPKTESIKRVVYNQLRWTEP